MKNSRRILVIGPSCSGKTFISKKIASELKLDFYDLDFFHFNREFKAFDYHQREGNLKKLTKENEWIACGILDYQIEYLSRFATHILFINSPRKLVLIKRYFFRFLYLERRFLDTFSISMIRWLLSYKNRPRNGLMSHQNIIRDFEGLKVSIADTSPHSYQNILLFLENK